MSRKGREGQRKEEERETGKAQKSRFKKKRPHKKGRCTEGAFCASPKDSFRQ